MKNPLNRRIFREIKGDWKKYFVIFMFFVLTIGFVAGMYVANHSMLTTIDKGIKKYNRENGHFELSGEMSDSLKEKIEDEGITVYELNYKTCEEDNDSDGDKDSGIRVYKVREEVNIASVIEGDLPENNDEIAIDRMHADNNDIEVGDVITVSGKEYKVSGLIALVDYSTLFESNTDIMFDAIKFDVGLVTAEEYDNINASNHYNYAWKYDNEPDDDEDEKKVADDLMEKIVEYSAEEGLTLEDYLPEYLNQAINFAPDDMGSDKSMGGYLLYILVVVIAFIFAITVNSTIENEAQTIGTLRATGYTRKELLIHYMSMPVIVTFVGATVGNILGYTFFKEVVISMYYNSYSLLAYKTYWSSEAFVKTTIVPVALMLVINFVIISKKLKLPILKFMRRDFKKTKKGKTMRLPSWSFFKRFRMRIILQNLSNYVVMVIGICFVFMLMVFAAGMPATLKEYQDKAEDGMFSKYQYFLKSNIDVEGNKIETENKDSEYITSKALVTVDGVHAGESINVYGFSDESDFIDIDFDELKDNEVYISQSYSEKFGYEVGDEITLKEKYVKTKHKFKVVGIYDYKNSLAVFGTQCMLNKMLDYDEDFYNCIITDEEITDIDEMYIYSDFTAEDVVKVSRQLDHSMGSYMLYFKYVCVILAAFLLYLLTKIIIEKNELSISMVKILGYNSVEIARLYLVATTIVVVIGEIIGLFVGYVIIKKVWNLFMYTMEGWYDFYVPVYTFAQLYILVFLGYLFIACLDFRRIKKIPMDKALKNAE